MAERWGLLEAGGVLTGDEAVSVVAANVRRGVLTTWFQSDSGRSLVLVSNGDRAMLVVMEGEGDAGEHAITPDAPGVSDGFVLENGQADSYADCDTVPLADALQILRGVVGTGRPPAGAPWSIDR